MRMSVVRPGGTVPRLNGRTAPRRSSPAPQGPEGGSPGRFDPVRIALFALLVFTISRLHYQIPLLASLRPALLLMTFIALWALLAPGLITPALTVRGWPAKVVLALAAWACLSVPTAISVGNSASFLLDAYFKVLFISFVLVAALRTPRDLRFFVWAYVISCGILAWMAIFVFDLEDLGTESMRLGRMYTYDSNDLASILGVGIPLTLLMLQTSGRALRIVSVLHLAAIAVALARTGSRGGFIGLALSGLAMLVLLTSVPLPKRLGMLGVVIGGLTLAAPPGYWAQMATVLDFKEDYNWEDETGRRQVALRGIGYMMQDPLTGVGIANFERAEGTISDRARRWMPGMPGIRWTSPHNSYVQVAAELGIPGFLLFVVLVFGGMIGSFRLHRRLPRSWLNGSPEQRFLFLGTIYLTVAFVSFATTVAFLSFAYVVVIYILVAYLGAMQRLADEMLRSPGGGVRRRAAGRV